MGEQKEIIAGKEQILSRLYTLRAGLSVVSQEKDEFEAIKTSAEKQRNSVQSKADNDLHIYEHDVENEKSIMDYYAHEIEERIVIDEKANSKINQQCILYRVLYIASIVLLTVVLAVMFSCFLIGISSSESRELLIITVPLGALSIVLGLAIFFSKLKYKNLKVKILMIDSGRRLADIQRDTSDIKNDLNSATTDYVAALAELDKAKKRHKQSLETANKVFSCMLTKAESHISAGSAITAALEKTYSDLIDCRDWGNIDYIIYCLETRRADNMKEALRLNDEEKRTDRIVAAVENATAEICRTMNKSIAALQNDMRNCFNILSNQITLQTTAIMNNIDSVRSGVATQSAYLEGLASEVKLNNALREKANVTSMRLADDVEYIRRYELR